MVKVISFYLPQFYTFKENDEWWGKGFTEWTNVRKAEPLYSGHYQPRVPLNENYYTLDNKEIMKWQISLAKDHNVYGFCFYHYYFGNNKFLMEKPVEIFLKNKDLDINFCLCWANHNWTRTWVGGEKDILMEVKYGGESELKEYFNYLLPYFKDERYIKVNNKPLFVIYEPEEIPNLFEMKGLFDKWCKDEGFDGISFASQDSKVALNRKDFEAAIDHSILYEPNYTIQSVRAKYESKSFLKMKNGEFGVFINQLWLLCKHKLSKFIKISSLNLDMDKYSYKKIWKAIVERNVQEEYYWLGGIVDFDSSPRRQRRGLVLDGANPDDFSKFFKELVKKSEKLNNEKESFIFVTAWNEWGEGAYLEPDEKNKCRYLEGIRDAVRSVE